MVLLYAAKSIAQGSVLDVATVFTTVAALAVVTHPANMIMTIVPRAVASLANFDRIQEYLDVVDACCLGSELAQFPKGDKTRIGNRGMNLSGGQQQRVALARVLYSSCQIAILDDPLTALDGTTEQKIIDNLMGPHGWFRNAGTTVFFITNSAQHFHIADRILLVNSGKIQEQSTPAEMKASSNEISKFSFSHMDTIEARDRNNLVSKQHVTARVNQDAEEDLCL
ncbi:hypothetical protein G7Z17_g3696 [Cylindrodendrum hubeiense]|uniref:ABC transporter domain-containing protein n=1 Tax=Cylindrodendrum hubeiense TaxID=595255 RepID=A0A9P5HHD0_9HYPO|nr:hypothetical protein G7Z17_g3696 [Cylindrodendrum hubeiense]